MRRKEVGGRAVGKRCGVDGIFAALRGDGFCRPRRGSEGRASRAIGGGDGDDGELEKGRAVGIAGSKEADA